MDEAFGHWLAGFVDGEGCFFIGYSRAGSRLGVYSCRFLLQLRDDDADCLFEAQRRTGLGVVHFHQRPASATRPNDMPYVKWEISAKHECLALVKLFEAHPLRAKKKRDFAIWSKAVRLQTRRYRTSKGPQDMRIWNEMKRLKAELETVRRYRSPSVVVDLDLDGSFDQLDLAV